MCVTYIKNEHIHCPIGCPTSVTIPELDPPQQTRNSKTSWQPQKALPVGNPMTLNGFTTDGKVHKNGRIVTEDTITINNKISVTSMKVTIDPPVAIGFLLTGRVTTNLCPTTTNGTGTVSKNGRIVAADAMATTSLKTRRATTSIPFSEPPSCCWKLSAAILKLSLPHTNPSK